MLPETVGDAALLHDGIGGVAGFYLCIDAYMPLGDRAVPDIVVAFAPADKSTLILRKQLPYPLFVFRHYKASLSRRSDWKFKVRGALEWFRESSSGTAKRTRSSRASKEPDSSTRPGTSSLSATQTQASGSQVILIVKSI